MRPGDTIFCDQYSHASIVDGAILAKSKTVFFRHNNPMDLERKLNSVRGKKLVVVEGVYSMDGDVCVLPEIVEVAKRHGARILIDEAHSTFLFGPNGRGVAEHFGLDEEVDFHLGTFSKSLGGQGGFVCGSQDLIDYVNAFGRSRFFSCNLAPPLAAGLLAGLRIVEGEPQLRAQLWSNVAYLRRRFAEEGIDIGKSTSQVMPVLVNNDAKVFAMAEKIQDRGPVPAARDLSRRAQAQVAAAHLGLRRAQRGRAGDGGAGDRGRAARRRDMPELTRYGFRDAISGFFEFPTENARRILPPHLEPVELHHGTQHLLHDRLRLHREHGRALRRGRDVGDRGPPGEARGAAAQGRVLPVPGGHHHQGRPRPRHRALAPAALDGGRGDRLRAQGAKVTPRAWPWAARRWRT